LAPTDLQVKSTRGFGLGRLAWVFTIVLLAFSLYEFSEPDLGSGLGLFIIFLVLFVGLRRFKVKW
jgi:hypothetical protein